MHNFFKADNWFVFKKKKIFKRKYALNKINTHTLRKNTENFFVRGQEKIVHIVYFIQNFS